MLAARCSRRPNTKSLAVEPLPILDTIRTRILTLAVPESAPKQRKTLAEQAGEPYGKQAVPPSNRSITNGVKSAVARTFAASTSRVGGYKPSKIGPTHTFGASVGAGVRSTNAAPTARPKSAYGGHVRSKSHQQVPRPRTATKQLEDDDEDDDERAERKGVHTFSTLPISKRYSQTSKHAGSSSRQRPVSLFVSPTRAFHKTHSRVVSSPSILRPCTPVQEEPTDSAYDSICASLGELELGSPKAAGRRSQMAGEATLDTNPFLMPPPSQIPRATPKRQVETPTPSWPRSTPFKQQPPPPFLNRFTNDRCPDFYDGRMEAMEREFRSFKEKMEGDMQKTTDYKETIQQLQSRGT